MIFVFTFCHIQLYAQGGRQIKPPANLTAASIVKLLSLEKNISSSSKDITIYVLDAPDVAKELEKIVKKNTGHIGKAKLTNILQGKDIPDTKPDVIYIGKGKQIDQILQYTRSNKVVSITWYNKIIITKGITLCINVIIKNRAAYPYFQLNLSAAQCEGTVWDVNRFNKLPHHFIHSGSVYCDDNSSL